jgi:polyisoprenyl-teichoic acid--peptidoglycan teichoic acid transferase
MVLLVSFASILVLSLVGGVVYVASIDRSVNQSLHRSTEFPPDTPSQPGQTPRPPEAKHGAQNYLILGSDSRDRGNPGAGRSDVLMLAHLSGDRQTAALISLPRDMWVNIPGHGKNKINAAFAFGGPRLTIRTIEGMLGVRIDHVALVDFSGLVAVTEALGGVTVDNPHYSVSQGWAFPVGTISIRGEQALAYVRERKQLPRGDLDRAERQRLVVQAILRKGLSPSVLANPIAFNRFVTTVAGQITVDDQLTARELRKIALSLGFGAEDVASLQAPIKSFGTSPGGQSIDVVDSVKLGELASALRNDVLIDYLRKYPEG